MSKRICVFGSSIAHGHNDSNGGGWCDRLKREYFKNGEWSVYNLGISGDTSKDVLERFKKECEARSPKVVLMDIGINDSTFDKDLRRCRVLFRETKENLEKFIEISRRINSKIIFIGLTKVIDKLLTPAPWQENLSYSNKDVKKYDKIIKEVADENDIPYCPMYDLLKDKDLNDGLHPNSVGHQKMFERIKSFLEKNIL